MNKEPDTNKKKKEGKKKKCRICKFGLAVIVIGIILIVLINPILNWVVKGMVEDAISSSRYGRQAQIGSLSFSLFSNSLSIEQIDLLFANNSKFSDKTVGIKTEKLQIDGVGWLSLLFGSGLSVDSAYAEHPFVTFSDSSTGSGQDSTDEKLYDMLPGKLRPLKVGKVNIDSAQIYRRIIRESDIANDTLRNVDLAVSNININGDESSSKLGLAEDVYLHIDSLVSKQLSSGYRFLASDIELSSLESFLSIKKLDFKPFLSDEDFFARHKYRTERFIFDANNINVTAFDFGAMLKDSTINIGEINTADFYFEVLTDKRLPKNPVVNMAKMPAEMLLDTGYKIDVKKIRLNGQISKQALHPYSENASVIFFTGVKFEVENLKNFGDDECTLYAWGNMQDSALLEVHLAIDLTMPEVNFNYYGSLGAMDATEFNSQLIIANNIRIDSGEIEKIDYNVTVRNGIALVAVTPVYSNLKITVLDEKDKEGKTIKSFLLNAFKIRKSNPKNGKEPVVGRAHYEPGPGDTFLDFMWQSLLHGLGDVVGF